MKIAIIGAMEVEIKHLREALENRQEKQIHQFQFYTGTIGHHEVVVLLSGVGKVSAAVSTTLLIDHFAPDLVINTGTAGGLRNVAVKDIILATGVKHHDVDLTAFGYQLGQPSQMPPAFIPDAYFLEKAQAIITQHQLSANQGLIVSGDAFINQPEKFEWIKQAFPEAKAVEMEAAAIAQVCHQMRTPFIILRAISDIAGEGNAVSFETFVAEAGKRSAEINIALIKSLD
ncbi:5'-methylthioadenosine/adenosylhomocysteine nucleosidase [Riemerella columbina]|uniref:5'-methylthioadenosine/adenosylhomocysteine nucleosidase n=1 Tax=Riemerella columbina TaxID=103810 RepID=UPI00266F7230|nr:5'-methylthioadenosine/adenosylhomocysteine nucleosidase [Riemerella columbina]WKS94826.1 5'-methylthioadenosine/adenosylhomocysteine nucleosidase [Riemerella columbina]